MTIVLKKMKIKRFQASILIYTSIAKSYRPTDRLTHTLSISFIFIGFQKYEAYIHTPEQFKDNTEWLAYINRHLTIGDDKRVMKQFTMKIPATSVERKFFNTLLLSFNDKRGEPLIYSNARKSSQFEFDDYSGILDPRADRSSFLLQEKKNTTKYTVTVHYPV